MPPSQEGPSLRSWDHRVCIGEEVAYPPSSMGSEESAGPAPASLGSQEMQGGITPVRSPDVSALSSAELFLQK